MIIINRTLERIDCYKLLFFGLYHSLCVSALVYWNGTLPPQRKCIENKHLIKIIEQRNFQIKSTESNLLIDRAYFSFQTSNFQAFQVETIYHSPAGRNYQRKIVFYFISLSLSHVSHFIDKTLLKLGSFNCFSTEMWCVAAKHISF